jgi:ribosomal protein S27AE
LIFIGSIHDRVELKKCSNCGTISIDAEHVCGVCGADLSTAPTINLREEQENRSQPVDVRRETTQLEMARPIVAVGLGETLTEFFRHCPSCGRRFHVYLENKKIVESHMETVRTVAPSGVITRTGSKYGPAAVYVATVHEGKSIFLDVEEFQYNYTCGHCGHEWSEKHTKEHRMNAGK